MSSLIEKCKEQGFSLYTYNCKTILEDMKMWLRTKEDIHINITIDMSPIDDETSVRVLQYYAEIYDLDSYNPATCKFRMLCSPLKGANYSEALEIGIDYCTYLLKAR